MSRIGIHDASLIEHERHSGDKSRIVTPEKYHDTPDFPGLSNRTQWSASNQHISELRCLLDRLRYGIAKNRRGNDVYRDPIFRPLTCCGSRKGSDSLFRHVVVRREHASRPGRSANWY